MGFGTLTAHLTSVPGTPHHGGFRMIDFVASCQAQRSSTSVTAAGIGAQSTPCPFEGFVDHEVKLFTKHEKFHGLRMSSALFTIYD